MINVPLPSTYAFQALEALSKDSMTSQPPGQDMYPADDLNLADARFPGSCLDLDIEFSSCDLR